MKIFVPIFMLYLSRSDAKKGTNLLDSIAALCRDRNRSAAMPFVYLEDRASPKLFARGTEQREYGPLRRTKKGHFGYFGALAKVT